MFWVLTQIGNASTPANFLKSAALPSITGIAPNGPIFPSPKTAEPSDKTAIVFDFKLKKLACFGSLVKSLLTSATPGVYASVKSFLFSIGDFNSVPILPLYFL